MRSCVSPFAGMRILNLLEHCDRYRTVGLYRMNQWLRTLRRWGASEAVMVGRVSKARMHDPFRLLREIPDIRTALLWYRRLDTIVETRRSLQPLRDELARGGVDLLDSTTYIQDSSPRRASLERPALGSAEFGHRDGWPLLEKTVEMDIGQSIAVREGERRRRGSTRGDEPA